jgi:ceramide glucosyltransferase
MTVVVWAAASFVVLATALHLAGVTVAMIRCRSPRASLAAAAHGPPVSLVIPVCGLDNYGEATLESAFLLNYPRYELIFCAARADEPAAPLVRRLIAKNPRINAQLLVGNERISPNPKLNNVSKGWCAAANDWIVIADSNILMRNDYIQRLFATWHSDTGLVCAPPTGCLPVGFWAELECAFLNHYQARWQYLADSLGVGFAQGKTLFWRRSDLEQAGGIRALGTEAAEDAASTKIVREAGLRVRLVNPPASQPLGRRSAREVWKRQSRWARLRRATFPLFFVPEILSGATAPIAALIFVALQTEIAALPATVLFAALWYGTEFALSLTVGWPVSRYFLVCMLLRDLMLPALWLDAWRSNQFEWRGTTMHALESARHS